MTPEMKKSKERILETALSLFAQRGFAAVGVREIAEKANVNISMISYYYNGKIGILVALFEVFHNQYHQAIVEAIDEDKSPEASVRAIIHNLIDFVRTHTDLVMVVFNALPLDIPEIKELKTEKIKRLIQTISELAHRLGIDPKDKMLISIVGPSLLSIILTHFRLKSIQKEVFHINFNDDYYQRYKEIISTLFLYGVKGLAQNDPIQNGA